MTRVDSKRLTNLTAEVGLGVCPRIRICRVPSAAWADARRRRRAWMQGASGSFSASATEGSAGVLDSTSRSPKERNEADMPGSAAEVEAS